MFCLYSRTANNNITVFDLSGQDRPIPNPVRTFEEAFRPYRKNCVVTQFAQLHVY